MSIIHQFNAIMKVQYDIAVFSTCKVKKTKIKKRWHLSTNPHSIIYLQDHSFPYS